uniref:Uncharacterized protein n=1 Tax=Pyxicephalus adspersus TaxID=30357 RepID=A0AAV2ZJA7_PYXAD|nr:TPA: hypothetical protein GDO54_016099 [Pyxicephalus adspersus]
MKEYPYPLGFCKASTLILHTKEYFTAIIVKSLKIQKYNLISVVGHIQRVCCPEKHPAMDAVGTISSVFSPKIFLSWVGAVGGLQLLY